MVSSKTQIISLWKIKRRNFPSRRPTGARQSLHTVQCSGYWMSGLREIKELPVVGIKRNPAQNMFPVRVQPTGTRLALPTCNWARWVRHFRGIYVILRQEICSWQKCFVGHYWRLCYSKTKDWGWHVIAKLSFALYRSSYKLMKRFVHIFCWEHEFCSKEYIKKLTVSRSRYFSYMTLSVRVILKTRSYI